MEPDVLSELRILSSADFDATSLLTIVIAGDGRLLDLLRHQDLVPLGTRIRTRLITEAATRDELLDLLQHALAKAGNATLMTEQLMDTLVDHSAGIRPCTKDTLPFVGMHPQQSRLGIFNSFGSKGSLMIPYYARQFSARLQGSSNMAEADIMRYRTDDN